MSILDRILTLVGDGYCADLAELSEREMRSLNLKARQKDAPTDVLSFPSLCLTAGSLPRAEDYPLDVVDGKLFLGSIAICPSVIKKQAVEYQNSYEKEYAYMLCHSVLHLLGYDHEDEADRAIMRTEEEKYMTELFKDA